MREKETNEQWEYKAFSYRHSIRYDDGAELNRLGEQGWEAYAVRDMDSHDCYVSKIFLKRRVQKGGAK